MHRPFTAFVLLLLSAAAYGATADTVPTTGSPHPMPNAIGLTLSGGGAKGIAHIGVIQALEENGIPIDCITGTSMGAIVGSLYSMGYSPDEMLQLISSKPFQYWSTGRIDSDLTYYFLENAPNPANVNLSLGKGGSDGASSVLPSSLINPLPMNLAFVELFAPYTARCGGDFNRLMVPFRCVASDVNRKRKAIFSQGDLGDCVRASMSFPMVFHPIEIDGRPMYDGGIYDNFPIDVMLSEFNPQFVIGVDVSSGNSPDNPNSNMMDQLESLIMQYSDYEVPSNRGLRLKMDLDRFGLLDFGKAREIYKIGYDYAMAHMDSIKARISPRREVSEVNVRRKSFKVGVPKLLFDSVEVTGGNRRQDEYLNSLFREHHSKELTMDHVRDAYYRALTSGKLRNFMPHVHYNPSSGMFNMNLKATVKNDFNLGVGGFLTTTTNSMLYLSGAFRTLSFNSLDMSLSGWVGQSYLAAEANAKIQLLRSVPSSIGFQAVASRQKYFPEDRFFFQTSDPTVFTREEYFGRFNYGVAVGRHGKAEIGIGVGHDNNHFRHVAEGDEPTRLHRTAGQLAAHYEHYTLDNRFFPTSGSFYQITARGYLGKYAIKDSHGMPAAFGIDSKRGWGRLDASWKSYFPVTNYLSLGTSLQLTATTDKILPDYYGSLAASPSYVPTSSMVNVFTPDFRARQFAVAGVEPIWVFSSMVQLRSRFEGYLPYRSILRAPNGMSRLGRPWHDPEFFGELRGVFQLSFASVSAYVHYTSAMHGKWNFGLSFGVYLPAASFFD
ncbi:MAG: patatin-like phospholipase family protein [Bacteroides sp.]|nr:patatin-like phospholipase family protein [Bacteroides sp.]